MITSDHDISLNNNDNDQEHHDDNFGNVCLNRYE